MVCTLPEMRKSFFTDHLFETMTDSVFGRGMPVCGFVFSACTGGTAVMGLENIGKIGKRMKAAAVYNFFQ